MLCPTDLHNPYDDEYLTEEEYEATQQNPDDWLDDKNDREDLYND